MKRYKLKKDLPTFKAGDEFYLDSNNDLRIKGSDIMAYNYKTLERFPNILKDWFEEVKEESKRWRANHGATYWCLYDYGGNDTDIERDVAIDNYRYKTGNYFKTAKEAAAYKKYLIARQVLLDDAKGGKWKKDGNNCCAYYDYEEDEWTYDDTFEGTQTIGVIYFQNPDDIEESLKNHGNQWEIVRKYEMGK